MVPNPPAACANRDPAGRANPEQFKTIHQRMEPVHRNIFNSALLQADYNHPLKNKSVLFASAQLIPSGWEMGVTMILQKHIYLPNAKAMTMGARIGWKNEQWETSLNYNRITTMAVTSCTREWGRDPFFTFLPGRNEGFGGCNGHHAQSHLQNSQARSEQLPSLWCTSARSVITG